MTVDTFAYQIVRYVDKILYSNGIYCSPDLLELTWDSIDTILSVITVILLGMCLGYTILTLPRRT
jgi:hypothetical protein